MLNNKIEKKNQEKNKKKNQVKKKKVIHYLYKKNERN